MDGRVQEPLRRYIIDRFGCTYVDTVTMPGIDGALARDSVSAHVHRMASISVDAHGSGVIVVSGHHDCAGNPVDKMQHIADISDAVETVKAWNMGVPVIGLWVNDTWQVESVV